MAAPRQLHFQTEKSEVWFSLQETVTAIPGYQMAIRVVSAEIPTSYYVINQDTNTLIVNGMSYVLDEGNYSVDDLQQTFQQMLSGDDITVTYSYVRNKFTFASNTVFTIAGESTILDRIGFNAVDHTGTVVTSDYAVDLSGTKFIYIYTNLATSNLVNGVRNGCLVKISAIADMNSMIMYSDSNAMPNYISDQTISQIFFKLVDDDDHLIDFEGRSWSITL